MTEITAAFNKVRNYANETIKIYNKYPQGKQIEIVTKTILVAALAGLFGALIFDIIGFLALFAVSGVIAFDYFTRHPEALNFYTVLKKSSLAKQTPSNRPQINLKDVKLNPRRLNSPPPIQRNQVKRNIEYYAKKGENTVKDFVEDIVEGSPTEEQRIQRNIRDGLHEIRYSRTWSDIGNGVKKFFRS